MTQRERIRARRRPRRSLRWSQHEALEPRHLLAAEVIINEIMYHPPSGQDRDEWIELYNHGDAPAQLSGYRLVTGVDFEFPEVTLDAGSYLVVAADVGAFAAQYPDVTNVVGNWTGRLSNRSEDITLADAAGNPLDHAKYADSGDWAARRRGPDPFGVPTWSWLAPHDGEGSSAELVNVSMPHDLGHNWMASTVVGGTPGGENSTRSDDIAPAIADVQHVPVIPKSNDEVAITARVVDESQVSVSVTLFYRESSLEPGSFDSMAMRDDGRHGDGAAGDGVFGATLPPRADGAVIEFYVASTDATDARRTSPAASDELGGQEANYLYQVDDSERPADLPLFRTIMTVADRAQFARHNRNSDALSNATFIATVGGVTESRYNAGVRYRGSGTRTNAIPNNRINLPSDRPWQNVTQLNINSNNPQNQVAGSVLFAMAELPAGDMIPVRMLSNEQDLARGGFYAYVEVLNGDWADRHFPNDAQGNVYRGRRANEGPPGGLGAGLNYFGEDQSLYVSYLKGTNSSQADYSDVVQLTNVLNNAPDDLYVEQLSEVVDIDQWLRVIATIDLIGYGENGLLTGDRGGDDYAMYRGVEDTRFLMVPYDLDDLFINTPLLQSMNVPALNRLLSQPEIRTRYYAQVFDLMDNALALDRVRPALTEALGGVRTPAQLDRMFAFLESRFQQFRNRFSRELSATSNLPEVDGFYRTTDSTSGPITGTAPIVTTRRVEVNGVAAVWDAIEGSWSLDDLPLQVGYNRLHVRALDASGQPTDELTLDILRTAPASSVNGTLDVDTTWTAAAGPYQVDGDLTLAAGVTLTIEPGTAVYFGNNARLVVRGRLVAEGTETAPLLFTRVPGSNGSWNGLQFRNSASDNSIRYALLQFGQTDDGLVGLENSRLELDHVTLDHTSRRRIRSIDSSLVVRNSTFTTIAALGQPPATDNFSEHIWGRGIPADGQWIIENNVFGHTTGHNDLIDFDAPRLPNPIPIIRNNVFSGGGDDALDMTGDVYIEGNIFRNFIKDQFNIDPGESNTISASSGTFYVIRNVFENVQHVSLIKEQAYMHFLNNTVVGSERAPLYFDLPGQTSGPGIGAKIEGSVFAEVDTLFDQVRPNTDLTLDYSFVPAAEVARGIGNLTGNPQLDTSDNNRRPLAGSPLLGSGRSGTDMGAALPAGVVVLGEPPRVTSRDSATLTLGGAGMVSYRFRVNEGPWSDPQSIETAIELSGLTDGDYVVDAIGQNLLGLWQPESAATRSASWRVDSTLAGVRINELLASNTGVFVHEGTLPDVIELYNIGRSDVDLSDLSLTDEANIPRRFVFPPDTMLRGGEYLVLFADTNTNLPGIHLGFSLSTAGEGVYLYDAPARGGGLVDSVEFGVQASDISLGIGNDLTWTVTYPTLGGPNVAMPQSDPGQLRINEWLADPEVATNNDFVELYNAGFGPVDMGGLFLTDNPVTWQNRHLLPPLSVIAGNGYQALVADGTPQDGADHVNFKLSRLGDMLGLYDAQLRDIDIVRFAAQQPDQSEGFSPNGSSEFATFPLPTPGLPNPSSSTGSVAWVPLDANWRYEQSGQDLGTDWRGTDYDDSAWQVGPAALFVESSAIPAPKNTPLDLGQATYYFRHDFNVPDPAAVQSLALTLVVDDGAVVYLNGDEVLRVGMPNGNVGFSTFANRTVGNATVEGPFDVPLDALVTGRNVLAVEVHQVNTTSSDVVMALQLDGQVVQGDLAAERALALQRDLRITELMYNPLGGNAFEFIEVQNTGLSPLDLAGVRLAGGVDFTFPALQLGPDQFAVVVGDTAAFRQRYGNLALVAGQFEKNLSNSGEVIQLVLPDPFTTNIVQFEYSDGWYPDTDGRGFSLVIDDPLASRGAWTEARNWRASNFINGSPGFVDSGLDVGILKINEVLARTDGLAGDQIEILNTTESVLDISGWYLSNDPNSLTKYRVAAGTTLAPGQFVVFTATDHFGAQFTLNDDGGDVILASPDAVGAAAGFVVRQSYGAAEQNESLGRYQRSDGGDDFVIQAQPTLGMPNSAPRVDDVVISEIDYSPTNGDEFIELHNRGGNPVALYSDEAPDRTWSLGGAVDFRFPMGVQLPPDGYILVVAGEPDAFRQTHNIPAEIVILGPYAGSLDDVQDDLRLLRPVAGRPSIDLLVDRVNYSAEVPWPTEAGSGASSLIRMPLDAYGNDPTNWAPGIAGGTPGTANRPIDTTPASAPSELSWQVTAGPAVNLSWTASSDPETDVTAYRIFRDQQLVGTSTSTRFVDTDVTAPSAYVYHVSAMNAQGLESDQSDPLDVRLMSIESVISRFANQVVIRFSEPVVAAAAAAVDNYRIEGVQVLDASLAADGQTVSLTTSELQRNTLYGLTVANLVGTVGTPFPPDLQFPFSYEEGIPGFTVRGVQSGRTTLRTLADMDTVLAAPPDSSQITRQFTDIYANVNFSDDDDHVSSGTFGNDVRFPTDVPGAENSFLIHANGFLTVQSEQAGIWTFGANIDAPQTVNTNKTVLPAGSSWKYSDGGVDLGTQWREFDFDDGGWAIGSAEFGYGDGDEVTLLDFGADANNKIPTYYFRTSFHVDNPADVISARGFLTRDDGAAVYLNGVEINRQNLAPDAGFGDFATRPSEPPFESAPISFLFDPAVLRQGDNVLAIEVHQSGPTDEDVSFDLGLELRVQENSSTDGFRLLIDGNPVITADAPNSASERLGSIHLAAGAHTLEFDFFDATDGAEVELFAAEGQFSSYDSTNAWRLVGDRAGGGLGVTTDPLPPGPLVWNAAPPQGGFVARAGAETALKGSGIPAGFATELAVGEMLSALVQPEAGDATLTVRLRDSLRTLDTWIAAGPGASLVVPGITATANDTYILEVSSDRPTGVQIDALANAITESELASVASTNNTAAMAEDISASWLTVLDVSRAAVSGRTDGDGAADFYSLKLAQGDVINVASAWELAGPSRVELYSADLSLLAVGVDRSVANVIADYPIRADGTYYVRVQRDDVSVYHLVVTRGAGLDALPNDSLDTATRLSTTGTVLGALSVEFPGAPDNGTQTTFMPRLLTDGAGFEWNIQPEGYVSGGPSSGYDYGLYLSGSTAFSEGTLEQNGREIVLGPSQLGANVTLTRKIYVSPDHGFARYLETFTNIGNTPVTWPMNLFSNLGSDNVTQLVATSNGDDLFDQTDNWLITDDADGRNDPTLLHLFAGPGGQGPSTASLVADDLSLGFNLLLEPGETQIVMHFAAQNADRQTASQAARTLSELSGGALAGMSLEEIDQVVNFEVPDILDSYEIQLREGQEVTLTTATPTAGDDVRAGGAIDPVLSLFDPSGAQVAADDNGAADGRNAHLVWTAPADGRYVVQVASVQGAGAYRLTSSLVGAPPLSVVGSEPLIGQPVPALPNSWVLNFSSPVDIASVQASDLLINDQPALTVEFIDADSLRFTTDRQQIEGAELITLKLTEQAVVDYAGTGNQVFESSYVVDSAAPTIAAVLWNGEPLPATRLVSSGFMQLAVTFDEPIRSANLDTSDIHILVNDTQQILEPQSLDYDDSAHTLAISFFVGEGDYTLVISSADGALEDIAGNDLDGDSLHGSLPSGDGAAGGDYRVPFRVDQRIIDLGSRLVALKPVGSGAAQATWTDTIAYVEDVDMYGLTLARGERLAVEVALAQPDPLSAMSVEVRDPWGRIVGYSRVDANGRLPAIDGLTAVNDGVYQVRISDGSIGDSYTMTVLKNAVLEGGQSSPRNPIAIDTSRVDNPLRRYAVGGTSQPLEASELVWGVQPATGQIVILDPSSGDVAFHFAAPGNLMPSHTRIGLTMADLGQTLLFLNSDDDPTRLYRLDPWSGEVLGIQTLESGVYDGLTFDAGQLFLGRRDLDVARQTVAGDPIVAGWSTGAESGGLAGDDYGRAFGVFTDQMIHEFDPTSDSDSYVSSIPLPTTNIEGLAFDGTLLYAASASGALFTIAPDVEGTPVVRDVPVEGGALFGLAALSVRGGGSSGDGEVTEQEPNNSLASAQNVDGLFSLDADVNIGDETGSTSTSIPHVTVRGRGNGNFDFYSFTVSTAETRGLFDIDATSTGLDAYLRLYDPSGAVVAESDDSFLDAGSSTGLDSFIQYTFPTTGTYTIEVASCCVGDVPSGARYDLHVSLEAAKFPRSGDVTLIAAGANWEYWDQGTSPSANWNTQAGVDAGPWPAARAQLGYGDGDEQSVVSFGADENNKPITTYFRKTIEIADPASYAELWVDLLRDDAAAVYVNGQLVISDNLPAAFDNSTPAIALVDGVDENQFQSFAIDPGLLQPGRNVLAVEVHQRAATDPDLSFDLRLHGMVEGVVIALPSAPDRDAYTVDFTGSTGRKVDILLAGEQGIHFTQDSTLQLFDPAGQTLLAEATASFGAATNYDLAIRDFTVPGDGIYRIVFESAVSGPYSLLVSEGAAFDTEPNQLDSSELRQLDFGQAAFGRVALANPSSIVDPPGDTRPGSSGADIAEMEAFVEGNALIVTVSFYQSILPTNPNGDDGTFVYLELDVDQDPATGTQSFQNQSFVPGQEGGPLGVEFAVNASTSFGDQAILFNPVTGQQVASLPLALTDTSYRIEIPLADLGQDDGLVNLGVLSGRLDVSDAAPNDTFLTSRLGNGTDASDTDVYEIAVQQGQMQRVTVETLAGIDGRMPDGVYTLSILDGEGNSRVSDVDVRTDGRNADVVFTAPTPGPYRAVIEVTKGSARYVLSQQVLTGPSVLGSYLFYNHSVRDGNEIAANADDDAAIAHDKTPLRSGNPVRFENYSSFVHGINGLMIDMIGAPGQLSLLDFQFRVGNDNQPTSWAAAPSPREFLVREGSGTAGSDRVTLVWDDGVMTNQWLQVTVLATPATGLAAPDVFYYGNLVGETGDSPDEIVVSSFDIVGVRYYVDSVVTSDPYLERLDFNRDDRVDLQDESAASKAARVVLQPVFDLDPGAADSVFEIGDANFDDKFDEEDLLQVMQLGEFEDLFGGNSTWSEGDWDGDGDFTTSDLVFAFQQGFFGPP